MVIERKEKKKMECKDIGEGGVTLYVVRRLAHYRHGLPDGLESESLL